VAERHDTPRASEATCRELAEAARCWWSVTEEQPGWCKEAKDLNRAVAKYCAECAPLRSRAEVATDLADLVCRAMRSTRGDTEPNVLRLHFDEADKVGQVQDLINEWWSGREPDPAPEPELNPVPPGAHENRDLVALDRHFDLRCDALSKRLDALEQRTPKEGPGVASASGPVDPAKGPCGCDETYGFDGDTCTCRKCGRSWVVPRDPDPAERACSCPETERLRHALGQIELINDNAYRAPELKQQLIGEQCRRAL
jgi:hypothetical protein